MCDSLPEDTFTIIPVTSVDVTTWHDQMHPAFSMILEVFPHEKKGRYSETAHGWSKDSEFSLYLLFFSPLVNCHITKWKDPPMLFMGKLTTFRLGHGFNSKLLYQRVLAIWKKNKKKHESDHLRLPNSCDKWMQKFQSLQCHESGEPVVETILRVELKRQIWANLKTMILLGYTYLFISIHIYSISFFRGQVKHVL